jgi:hypothetical protein
LPRKKGGINSLYGLHFSRFSKKSHGKRHGKLRKMVKNTSLAEKLGKTKKNAKFWTFFQKPYENAYKPKNSEKQKKV